MGYEGPYSLTQRCASEFVATWMFVFLLESVIANNLLPKTKGHDIGFGWVALGVGLACFLPVQYFGYISSMVNPAMALANAVAEVIDWSDLLPIAVCQIAGAFLGGCTVWLFYLPHFATVPEPPPPKVTDELLRTRDYINTSSLAYASYNSHFQPNVNNLSQSLAQFGSVLFGNSPDFRVRRHEDILGRHSSFVRKGVHRCWTVNESDLHRCISRLHYSRRNKNPIAEQNSSRDAVAFTQAVLGEHPKNAVERQKLSEDEKAPLLPATSFSVQEDEKLPKTSVFLKDSLMRRTPSQNPIERDVSFRSLRALAHQKTQTGLFCVPASYTSSVGLESDGSDDDQSFRQFNESSGSESTLLQTSPSHSTEDKNERHEEMMNGYLRLMKSQRLHEASVKADRNAKLAVFAVRPAMFVPVCNLINEIISAMLLTSGILMLNRRGAMIWEGDKEVYMHGLKSFWVGILVAVLALCLNGPGIAMNPARDFGPRLAHWVLPIAGKGPSEWYYGWITVVGPAIGGLLGGVFYNLCDMLNESTVHRGYYTNALNALTNVTQPQGTT